jgi:hypothetical protein
VAIATRGNVSFYPIDPAGSAESRAGARRSSIATETGGFAIGGLDDYGDAYVRLVRENSRYYVIGYHRGEPRKDGKFHTLRVNVRRPEMTVVSRRGYTAPAQLTPATHADLLAAPIAVPGLTMRLLAVPLQTAPADGASGKVAVRIALQIDGGDIPMVEKREKYVNTIDVVLQAVDATEQIAHEMKDVVHLSVTRGEAPLLKRSGLLWATQMDLAPGRYVLRLAAVESVLGGNGSVLYDLDVVKPGLGLTPPPLKDGGARPVTPR